MPSMSTCTVVGYIYTCRFSFGQKKEHSHFLHDSVFLATYMYMKTLYSAHYIP